MPLDPRALPRLQPPTPGEELLISREASVQFARTPAFVFRVISVCPRPTYDGWAWVTGYQLDGQGQAVPSGRSSYGWRASSGSVVLMGA